MVPHFRHDHERALVHWWVPGDHERNLEPCRFKGWSNVNYYHFGGFGAFEYEGGHYMLIMAIGGMGPKEWKARLELSGRELDLPKRPKLPVDGPARLVMEDDVDGMAVMDGLQALYGKEKDRLAAAYVAREQATKEREGYLEANPPEPKDTVIHFWWRPREAQERSEGGAR